MADASHDELLCACLGGKSSWLCHPAAAIVTKNYTSFLLVRVVVARRWVVLNLFNRRSSKVARVESSLVCWFVKDEHHLKGRVQPLNL